jgi:hypothetical protein
MESKPFRYLCCDFGSLSIKEKENILKTKVLLKLSLFIKSCKFEYRTGITATTPTPYIAVHLIEIYKRRGDCCLSVR